MDAWKEGKRGEVDKRLGIARKGKRWGRGVEERGRK